MHAMDSHPVLQESESLPNQASDVQRRELCQVILSFDVEEHYQIEAARGLTIDPFVTGEYRDRLEPTVHWILEQLDLTGIKATFFVVGELAKRREQLIRT